MDTLQAFKVSLTDNQIQKIRREIKKGKPVISLRFRYGQLINGDYPLFFTPYQISHIRNSIKKGLGARIDFDIKQFLEPGSYEGGQFGQIASVLVPILGSIVAPLISKAIQGQIEKIKKKKSGKALYIYGQKPPSRTSSRSGKALFPYGVGR
jgi:hypothetical protein